MRSYLEATSQQWNKTRYIEPFPNIVMIGYHSLTLDVEMDSWRVWGGTGEPFSHRGKWSISFQNTLNHRRVYEASFLSQSVYTLRSGIAKDFVIARVGGSLKNSCSKKVVANLALEDVEADLFGRYLALYLVQIARKEPVNMHYHSHSQGVVGGGAGDGVGPMVVISSYRNENKNSVSDFVANQKWNQRRNQKRNYPSLIPFLISNGIRDGLHKFMISVSDSVSD
ncbi:hypothetical protein Syun_023760 [Stephania yunnanensis]|uniref:Uncharacterized protein n=1 Tax=Stephania yunnanensis TaxID=152371 RepID=A0AAP0FAD2_9MAGN